MALPDPIPRDRVVVGRDISVIPVNKRMAKAVGRAKEDAFYRDVENRRAVTMAEMDVQANCDIVESALNCETEFYDRRLAKVGSSRVRQQQLEESLQMLAALNQAVVLRYAR